MDPGKPSKIVFALDCPTVGEAAAAAELVAPLIGMIKVGLELFVHAGPSAVALGSRTGLPVFLDLKLHDIPETVERAVIQAGALGARLVTVHASGGRAMLKRAVTAAQKTNQESRPLEVCAVTVLTSLDDADLRDIGLGGSMVEAAVRLARMAYEEGVRWFVCSPVEVRALRTALGPDAVLITPGVRPAASVHGDQKRIATPEEAIRDGADWVVIGRPIRDASDPALAARAINAAIEGARR